MASTGWRRHDTHWVISLFGTAVGAGILFLPINLGLGIWPSSSSPCWPVP